MLIARLCLAGALLGAATTARSDSWTNHAGHVVEGRLSDFDGVWVTLVRTNGTSLRLPLSALCKADQQRVHQQKGVSVAPDFVVAAYKDAVVVLERYSRLPPSQQTPEARSAAIQMACAVFDGRIRARQAELTDKAVKDEVQRLRTLLAR